MAKSPCTFDDFLRMQHWPTDSVKERIFPIQRIAPIDAAQSLALLAYPLPSEQQEGGPHRFSMALLADMLRILRADGDIPRLPAWTKDIKPESMRNRITAGRNRLAYRYAAIQTLFSAGDSIEDRRANKERQVRTIAMSHAPDFSRAIINIPVRHENMQDEAGYRLVGSIPAVGRASLRSSIIYHRAAFGRGSGDENVEYIQIYNRYIKPIFPVYNLALVIWEASLRKCQEANRRRLHITDILMLQPKWAENLDEKVRRRDGSAIYLLRHLGVATCSCRMLKLV